MTISTIYIFPEVSFSSYRENFLYMHVFPCTFWMLYVNVRCTCTSLHLIFEAQYLLFWFKASLLFSTLRYVQTSLCTPKTLSLNCYLYKEAPQVWKSNTHPVYFSNPFYYFHPPFILDLRVTYWNTSFNCIELLTYY